MIKKRKYNDDKWIIARKPYSTNPKDHYLELVLAYLPNNTMTPYCSWIYNQIDNGFYCGHYYEFINNAIPAFLERGHSPEVKYNSAFIRLHDAVECHYVNLINEEDWEECESEHAQMISVYLHRPEGGLECISDHFDGKDAARFIRYFSNQFELPIKYQPDDLFYIKLKPIK